MRTLRSRASDRNDPAIRRATLSDHGYRGHRDRLPYSTPNARPVRISGHFPRFRRLNGRKVRVSRTLRRFSAAPPGLASEADAPTGNLRHSPARRPRAQAAPRPRRTCTPSRWCGAQPTTTSPDGSPVTSNIGCEDVHPARPRPPTPTSGRLLPAFPRLSTPVFGPTSNQSWTSRASVWRLGAGLGPRVRP